MASGTVTVSSSRRFADGSAGKLVVFSDDFPGLGGAVVELRRVSTGAVVAVDGVGPWAGVGRHLEVFDVLWPALSPQSPGNRTERHFIDEVSWPLVPGLDAAAWVRVRGAWGAEPGYWAWSGPFQDGGGAVGMAGTAECEVDNLALIPTALCASNRTVRVRSPEGGEVLQPQRVEVTVTLEGFTPAPRLATASTRDDTDGEPLRLADGRKVSRAAAPASALPFLLVDDTVPHSLDRIRGALPDPSEDRAEFRAAP